LFAIAPTFAQGRGGRGSQQTGAREADSSRHLRAPFTAAVCHRRYFGATNIRGWPDAYISVLTSDAAPLPTEAERGERPTEDRVA